MEGEPILKKTLVTMAAMVGANVLFVGTLSLGAVLITSHAVNPGGSSSSSKSETLVPAEKIDRPGLPAKALAPAQKPAQQI